MLARSTLANTQVLAFMFDMELESISQAALRDRTAPSGNCRDFVTKADHTAFRFRQWLLVRRREPLATLAREADAENPTLVADRLLRSEKA